MLKNYFNTAIRNFWRNKVFSGINVLGLAIGISAALVMLLIVYYEFSFDRSIPNNERVYRLVLDAKFGGMEGHSSGIPAPFATTLDKEVTGIEMAVPIFQFQRDATAKVEIATTTSKQPAVYKSQNGIVFTNAQYFNLIGAKFIAGNANAAMQDPFSVVLNETRAKQYFPSLAAAELIGKVISYNDIVTKVTGVIADVENSTSMGSSEFISFATIAKTNLQHNFMMEVWNDWMAYAHVYVKLANNTDPAKVNAQVNTMYKKYNEQAFKDDNNYISLQLQPLADVHFNRNYQGTDTRIADKKTLYGLIAIASFLLLLGCINFINLTTAQATRRAKEIGIRKTMGSSKAKLITQFLAETFLVTFIATIIAVILLPFLLNLFASFLPPGLSLDLFKQPTVLLLLLLMTVVVSLLAGLYPAFILSGYKPVAVFKGEISKLSGGTRTAFIRKSLTVSQFVIAQFFIIATLMVSKQINYSLNAELGFNKDAIVTFDLPRDTVTTHAAYLLQQIKALPGVENIATGFLSPADNGVAFTNISYEGQKEKVQNVQIRWGDSNYLKVYNINLLAGRNIRENDSIREFVINETYSKLLGFKKPTDAIGKYLVFNEGKLIPIVGVMADFHDQSFRSTISPIVFGGNKGDKFHIKLKPGIAGNQSWNATMEKMQQLFKQVYPEETFAYEFFDETIAEMYKSERNTATLLRWATALSIVISCLGLLGLAIFISNTRTKEIGIRKVLGATVIQIVRSLSTDLMKLVFLAFIIAVPFAWYATYTWLQDYAYRTPLSWWIFIVSGALMMILAIITLGTQTIKAAIANPIKSLRTE